MAVEYQEEAERTLTSLYGVNKPVPKKKIFDQKNRLFLTGKQKRLGEL